MILLKKSEKKTGADTLLYQTISDLKQAIGKGENQLCLSCLTGKYQLKSVKKMEELEKSIVKSRLGN